MRKRKRPAASLAPSWKKLISLTAALDSPASSWRINWPDVYVCGCSWRIDLPNSHDVYVCVCVCMWCVCMCMYVHHKLTIADVEETDKSIIKPHLQERHAYTHNHAYALTHPGEHTLRLIVTFPYYTGRAQRERKSENSKSILQNLQSSYHKPPKPGKHDCTSLQTHDLIKQSCSDCNVFNVYIKMTIELKYRKSVEMTSHAADTSCGLLAKWL
jgi:hypothetical protein